MRGTRAKQIRKLVTMIYGIKPSNDPKYHEESRTVMVKGMVVSEEGVLEEKTVPVKMRGQRTNKEGTFRRQLAVVKRAFYAGAQI